jgi:WD40 repeat protein
MNKDNANRILPGIQCFAWRGDGKQVALCPLNNEIWVFDTQGSPDISKWTKTCTLKQHFNMVMSLDWHPKTNLLLSASADRSLIVWKPEKDTFTPSMGMNQEKIAHLNATWNPRGDKFIVGSSSGNIYQGVFNSESNFWIAHSIKKKPIHKASVVCVDYDPLAGKVVASASLDGTI